MPEYSDALSLGEARERYFQRNGFGDDGGYQARWVKLRLGPLPLAFPNTAARVRAVRYHDLHHVVTGYDTDFGGEAEIAAWEIASSCRGFIAAWVLNLYAIFLGLFVAPGAVFRAFVRGRRTRNLYDARFDAELLASTVGSVRARLALDAPDVYRASGLDRLAFGFWCAIGAALTLLSFAPWVLLIALISRAF